MQGATHLQFDNVISNSKVDEQLEYCFAREKEIVFAQQKQSVLMSL